MYTKNLKHQIVIRVSDRQYAFLSALAKTRNVTISTLVRSLIDYFYVIWSKEK